MKKLISLFVAVLMVVSMLTISASADFTVGGASGADSSAHTQSGDVKVTITGDVTHKYAVDIAFGNMIFTCNTGLTWDPTTHQYKQGSGVTWIAGAEQDKIKIVNHSDQPIYYAIEDPVEVTTFGTLSIKFEDDNGTSPAAATIAKKEIAKCDVGVALESAPSATITVSIEGNPNQSGVSEQKLGTITLKISDS